jgi:hypothetical protein
MLKPILTDGVFWLATGTAAIVSLLVTLGIGLTWKRKLTDPSKKIDLQSEALRSSINGGITVAALILPLAITLVAYLQVQLQQTQHSVAVLLASVGIISLAVGVGVFNLYSMATVTNAQGMIEIKGTTLTYFPAQFVLQIMLLLSGLVLLGVFCFFFLNPVQTNAPTSQGGNDLPIFRSPLRVGQSIEEVVGTWGRPSARKDTTSENILTYSTPISTLTIVVRGGKIASITEQQKEGP